MSLNKLTDSSILKPYLNIGCNDIKCTSLSVNSFTALPTAFGSYQPVISNLTGGTVTATESIYSMVGSPTTGALLDMNIEFAMTATSAVSQYVISVPLPTGYVLSASNKCLIVGNLVVRNAPATGYSAFSSTQTAGASSFVLVFVAESATLLQSEVGIF